MNLRTHQNLCYENDPQRIQLPRQLKVKFKEYQKTLKHPFIIYADFETLVIQEEEEVRYEPCSFGLAIIDWKGDMIDSFFYRGEDTSHRFLEYLMNMRPVLQRILKENLKLLEMTDRLRSILMSSEKCHICGEKFDSKFDIVADHDHLTGVYRGPAHNECNLALRFTNKIPVVFHNFKNFDCHIIIQGINHELINKVSVIPKSIEKFIVMKMDDYIIIDSFAFLASSWDILAQNTDQRFKEKYLSIFFDDTSLLMKKGTLPYEYLDSWCKFEETKFPNRDAFFSKLKNSNIGLEEYSNVQSIWESFNCRNLGDLQDIYLKTDVCLLSAVFEQFRELSMEEFGLDPTHFYSSPGLTWSAAMKYTNVELQLLNDIDMIMMVERGIRGGISSAMTHYAKANNKYLPNYSPEEETSFITYLDVNNLYGYALRQPMPYSDFSWVSEDFFKETLELVFNGQQERGYFFEVDLFIDPDLHDIMNDYPLAPEKKKIDEGELSENQKMLIKELNNRGLKHIMTEKLVPNLHPTKRYVVHHRNLQFYMKCGMKVTNIHRILSLKERAWIQPYIDLCTTKRQQATTSFQKDFWKLLVNSLFGKSIENKRKYCNIKVFLNHNELIKNLKNPLFDESLILDSSKALLKCRKTRAIMYKPIFLGFTVLKLSKLHMYELHYGVFKRYYGEKLKLIYTDTDSFIYHIKTEDIFRDFNLSLI